jgi:Uma2 family endonuclease
MNHLTTTPIEDSSRASAEQRVILYNVSWDTYEKLLADLADQSSTRLTYDQGTLEIMTPSNEHEIYNRTIAVLVEILAEEMSIDIASLGSSTFKRDDLERGFEPDSCFYIENEPRIAGKVQIDLTVDPPPDLVLVIEVDITSRSLPKFPIYAQLGVPEIWRYDGQRLFTYKLAGDQYTESDHSATFPWLTSSVLTDFLQKSKTLKRTDLLRSFREMVREQQARK